MAVSGQEASTDTSLTATTTGITTVKAITAARLASKGLPTFNSAATTDDVRSQGVAVEGTGITTSEGTVVYSPTVTFHPPLGRILLATVVSKPVSP